MEYDYIVVGAGSAGSVMAARLSEHPGKRVLLLEAGGRDWHPFIHIPAGIAKLISLENLNWSYETEPEPQLENRNLYCPRGKVLGGSSSINAMIYCRGQQEDYDDWARSGCAGWEFDAVLPWFKRAQDQQRGADAFHATGGPLKVQDLRYHNPMSDVFINAAEQAGFPRNSDFNGERQNGIGFYQVTQDAGRRCSAARAYLKPARGRENLTVKTHALVEKILFDGQRATGVEVRIKGSLEAHHAGEIILCGGAINSPQLLMLSGVGPAAHLRDNGIEVAIDLPGVGQNLQDHIDVATLVRCVEPITYDHLNYSRLKEIWAGLRYLLTRNGPSSSNIAESGGFIVSQFARNDRPDIQMHFAAVLLDDHARNQLDGDGMTLHACPLRPTSRGQIRLASSDPSAAPRIFANYLGTEHDRRLIVECVRLSRKIFSQPAFRKWVGDEIFPGPEVQSEEAILSFARHKAETIYHPVGTCKMGHDEDAVVDPQLRVRGAEGLRVVDASIMPNLVSGNTNAPTIMIAEKCASLMQEN